MNSTELAALIEQKKGLLVEFSFGGHKQERALTYGPGKDIDASPTELPLRLPDNSVNTAVIFHVLEYIDPSQFFAWFDELHRVMQPNGVVYIAGPYGGDDSYGWISDPTHRTRIIAETFFWLVPDTPYYEKHAEEFGRPTPKPWKILTWSRVPGTGGTIGYNTQIQARKDVV